MQFILTGFTQETGFRVFAYEGVALDKTRTAFTVRADLAMTRRYGIAMQELPLLCQAILARREEDDQERTLTFTEEGMRLHADICAAEREAAQKRKAMRRTPTGQNGTVWTAPQPR